ncbi:hypothetical protein BZA70DRAFT_312896 [Myxozyma melibiosi]|uniref:SET domain-containing protein n=1 Tax=Myxozyma melibiosi TaxID=54550 RepID=A0ABR1EYR9_9ASCO
MSGSTNDLLQLAQWVVSKGGFCSENLSFSIDDKSGSTAHASSLINASESNPLPILSCPLSLVIDFEKAATYIWGTSSACPIKSDPVIAVRIYLCLQRLEGENAEYFPYIKTLPSLFGTPIFFTANELDLLRGTNLYGDVEQRRAKWITEHSEILPHIPDTFDKSRLTSELYLWACTVLTSRSFPSKIVFNTAAEEEDSSYPVLIPLVDSLNHYPRTPVVWNVDPSSFALAAATTIEEGREIFNNYGPKGNEELLMGYGFCLPDNEFDLVSLKLRLPNLTPDQIAILQTSPDTENSGIFYLTLAHPLPDSLVRLFCVNVANEAELEHMKSNTETDSLRCKLDALMNLSIAISRKLSGHRLPELRDESSSTERNIYLYISGQVRILSACAAAIYRQILDSIAPRSSASFSFENEKLRQIIKAELPSCGLHLETLAADARFSQFFNAVKSVHSDFLTSEMDELYLSVFIAHLAILSYSSDKASPYREWIESMRTRYDDKEEPDADAADQLEYMDDILQNLAEVCPEVFAGDAWSQTLLAWAMKVVGSEAVYFHYEERSEPMLVVITGK